MQIPYPQLEKQGITDQKVLRAIRCLPRELFVADNLKPLAYADTPLPIDCDQTISQPFIVAYMTEKLDIKANDKVLEIGTGSGFQAAVLSQLAQEVYTIEVYQKLSQQANKLLTKLGYENIKYKVGDGKLGWPEFAPFDKIIITALAQEIPTSLIQQLKVGGKMILPLALNEGDYLVLLTKKHNKIEQKKLIAIMFVPLI